jgi:hypothetical protein
MRIEKEDLDEKGLKWTSRLFIKRIGNNYCKHSTQQRQLSWQVFFSLTILTSRTFSRLPFLYQTAMKIFLRKDIKFY